MCLRYLLVIDLLTFKQIEDYVAGCIYCRQFCKFEFANCPTSSVKWIAFVVQRSHMAVTKSVVRTHTTAIQCNWLLPEVERAELSLVSISLQFLFKISGFSNYYERLIRSAAYCFRFLSNCRKSKTGRLTGPLGVEEIMHALTCVIKFSQCLRETKPFSNKSKIINFKPFLDKVSILGVEGRLRASLTPVSVKNILYCCQSITLQIFDIHMSTKNCHTQGHNSY